MKPINILLLLLLLVPAVRPLTAQENRAAIDCGAPLPQEQIVLHTSRELYLVGEKIWFKAYCLLNGKPSDELSKVLYVELFNAEKKVLLQQKFHIEKGIAVGALEIPQEALSGYHFLRAYTQYLRNFPSGSFACRQLAIVHPESPPPSLTLPKRDSLSLLLADGALLAGCPTRLLASFAPALCEEKERVRLQNERGETLAECSALYGGHALFHFVPAPHTAYQVVARMDNGQLLRKKLPPVQDNGLSCQAEVQGSALRIALRQPSNGGQSFVSVRVFSQNGRLLDGRRIAMEGVDHQFELPVSKLIPGLYYVVAGAPEEDNPQIYPVYYPGPPPLALEVSAGRATYGPKERVDLTITAPAGAECLLSVSARKKGLGEERPAFLRDNPWLLPSYLPNGHAWDKHRQEIALMLLAGQLQEEGHTFSANGTSLQWLPEIRGLTLSGLMRNETTGAPAAGEVAMAAVVAPQPQIHITETRADGSFLFTLPNQEGRQNLFVGWKDAGEAPPEILINSPFSNRFPTVVPSPLVFEAERHELFEELYLQAQLAAADEPDTKADAFDAPPPLLPITNIGKPDYTVAVAKFVALPSLEEVFREIVPYVLVKREKGRAYLDVYNETAQQSYDDPLVLLDNIPVFDIGRLLEIHPGSVEKIEVFNTNYLLGDYLFGGLVSLHTNTDDFAGYQWAEPAVFVRFPAVSSSPAFQHPVYPSAESRYNPKPDFRPQLYWNPTVEMKSGEASLECYTSSLAGVYEIIVRGVTREGRACIGRAMIEVGEGR